ncbi:MAG: DnaA/Hda family protein, partial [Rhodospirillaceae bacterium]
MKRGDGAVVDQAEWDRVKTRLRKEFGESVFKSWVTPITDIAYRDGEVELTVPTRFMRDWISTHYAERIRTLWNGENPRVRKVTLKVSATAREVVPTSGRNTSAAPHAAVQARARSADPASQSRTPPLGTDLSAPLDARYVFENFVVGKPNEFAYAAAKRVAESDQVSFNPLFLYGGVGLGKTHLMHAIAWEIRQRTPQR